VYSVLSGIFRTDLFFVKEFNDKKKFQDFWEFQDKWGGLDASQSRGHASSANVARAADGFLLNRLLSFTISVCSEKKTLPPHIITVIPIPPQITTVIKKQ